MVHKHLGKSLIYTSEQKCKEQSVELIQVLGKDISNDCSCCGSIGKHKMGKFICEVCGFNIEEKINTARNILKRGLEGKILNLLCKND